MSDWKRVCEFSLLLSITSWRRNLLAAPPGNELRMVCSRESHRTGRLLSELEVLDVSLNKGFHSLVQKRRWRSGVRPKETDIAICIRKTAMLNTHSNNLANQPSSPYWIVHVVRCHHAAAVPHQQSVDKRFDNPTLYSTSAHHGNSL